MRSKEKQVQIPYDLLTDLCRYHLAGITDDPGDRGTHPGGFAGINGQCRSRERYARNLPQKPVILSGDMFTPPLRGCFLLTGL